MPVLHSRHVAMTEPLARIVDDQVAEGRYPTGARWCVPPCGSLMEREGARMGPAEAARKEGPTHG